MEINAEKNVYNIILNTQNRIENLKDNVRYHLTDDDYKNYWNTKATTNPLRLAEQKQKLELFQQEIDKNEALLDKLIAHILT